MTGDYIRFIFTLSLWCNGFVFTSVEANDFVGPVLIPSLTDHLLPQYDAWCKEFGDRLSNTTTVLAQVGVNKTANVTQGYGQGMTEYEKLVLDARDLSVYSKLLTHVIVDPSSILGQQVSRCIQRNTEKFTNIVSAMNSAVELLNNTTLSTQSPPPGSPSVVLFPYERASTTLARLKASMRDLAEVIYADDRIGI